MMTEIRPGRKPPVTSPPLPPPHKSPLSLLQSHGGGGSNSTTSSSARFAPQSTRAFSAENYARIINHEFRSLQLDKSLSAMSVFDLIDHCSALFEELTNLLHNEKGLRYYVRAYLIFNYFVNTFIMVHFNGFSSFIESNHQDFIIYLNLYNFFRSDDIIGENAFDVDLNHLRNQMLDYLTSKKLLSFDVKLLFSWLNEYIDYLKNKDSADDDSADSDSPESDSHDSRYSSLRDSSTAKDPLANGFDECFDFNQRFPDISDISAVSNDAPSSLHAPKTPYPVNGALVPVVPLVPPVPLKSSKPIRHFHTNSPMAKPMTNPPLSKPPMANSMANSTPSRSHDPRHFSASPSTLSVRRNPAPLPHNDLPKAYTTTVASPQNAGIYSGVPMHPYHPQYHPQYQPQFQPQYQPHQPHQPQYQHPKKTSWRASHSVCGLKNLGSSCYINLTIQTVFGISRFVSLFSRKSNSAELAMAKSLAKGPTTLTEAVVGLLATFETAGGATVAPTKFLRTLSSLKPDFNIPFEQQDAQEFLLFFLDKLHAELASEPGPEAETTDFAKKWDIDVNKTDKEEYLGWYRKLIKAEGQSPVNDLFQGHVQSRLICNKCGYTSNSYSPFSILSLPIPAMAGGVVDLTDCLRYFTQDEVLSGDNAWNCPKCNKEKGKDHHDNVMDVVFAQKKSFRPWKNKAPTKKTSTAIPPTSLSITLKQLNIVKLPQVLFIHLSRFSMFTNPPNKLDTTITYPLRLKFNFMDHDVYYNLAGVVNHYGTLKSGHYTALVNKATSSPGKDALAEAEWCYFDDDTYKINVAHGDVTSGTMNRVPSRDVYVLCYERI